VGIAGSLGVLSGEKGQSLKCDKCGKGIKLKAFPGEEEQKAQAEM
jgi:hypothetical protein